MLLMNTYKSHQNFNKLHPTIYKMRQVGFITGIQGWFNIRQSINMIHYMLVTQFCLTLWPYGLYPARLLCPLILQARILEWVAIPYTMGSSQPRDWNQVSHIAGKFFIVWATREAHNPLYQ